MYMQCGIIIVKPLRSKGTDYNGPFLYDGRFALSVFKPEIPYGTIEITHERATTIKNYTEKIIDRIQEDHLALYHLLWAVGSFVSTAASLFTEKSGGIPSIPEEDGAGGAMGVSYKF